MMFTGLDRRPWFGEAVVACVRERGAELQIADTACRRALGRRLDRGQWRVPDRHSRRAGRFRAQAIARDAAAHIAGRALRRLAREPRAGAARGGSPRRPHRPGPRRRHRRGAARATDGFASVIIAAPAEDLLATRVQKGSIALDGVSLTISALEDRQPLGIADSGDACAHHARRRAAGRLRQRRGRRARKARRAAAGLYLMS